MSLHITGRKCRAIPKPTPVCSSQLVWVWHKDEGLYLKAAEGWLSFFLGSGSKSVGPGLLCSILQSGPGLVTAPTC